MFVLVFLAYAAILAIAETVIHCHVFPSLAVVQAALDRALNLALSQWP